MERIDLLWKAYEEACSNFREAYRAKDEDLTEFFRQQKNTLWEKINAEEA